MQPLRPSSPMISASAPATADEVIVMNAGRIGEHVDVATLPPALHERIVPAIGACAFEPCFPPRFARRGLGVPPLFHYRRKTPRRMFPE